MFQISNEHKDQCSEGLKELATLTVTQTGGASYKLSGAVGANGRPVLISINDLVLTQGIELTGNLLLFKSSASQVLGAVIGECCAIFARAVCRQPTHRCVFRHH